MIKIEDARVADREAVLAITLAAYQEYAEGSAPGFWARYAENIRHSVLESPAVILVARDGDEIKGSVLFCAPNEGAGGMQNDLDEMRLLAVPPAGRGQGVAGLLIAECERRAHPRRGLTLHTTHLMKTARAMYERRGYVRFPEIDFEPAPGFVVWGYKKTFGG